LEKLKVSAIATVGGRNHEHVSHKTGKRGGGGQSGLFRPGIGKLSSKKVLATKQDSQGGNGFKSVSGKKKGGFKTGLELLLRTIAKKQFKKKDISGGQEADCP